MTADATSASPPDRHLEERYFLIEFLTLQAQK
jgi:hypothetical protein